ncbi:hypothetical protein JKF63_06446 [Porcisia hertigi]|uniref:J domain-containing protein n=1 Tax=Porcisia hertigi TaxID=2761500 RepID=A0A837A9W9_9TRYP|nr:hypothetical protein JKF63_06446 [Porcisia hertigi]
MQSVFMGRYPARFSRARCCTADVNSAGSTRDTTTASTFVATTTTAIATATTSAEAVAAASAVLDSAPPPLRVLHKMRKFTDPHRQGRFMTGSLAFTPSFLVASAPSSLPIRPVRAAGVQAFNALALQAAPISTQLAMVPVRLLTQLVQWRRLRSDCASVLPPVSGVSQPHGGHSHVWTLGFRRRGSSARRRPGTRCSVAVRLLGSTAHAQPMTKPPALIASTSPSCSCAATQSIFSGSAVAPADSCSTGSIATAAAAALAAGPLHTAKRCYSSAAQAEGPTASTPGESGCSEERVKECKGNAVDGDMSAHERIAEENKATEEEEEDIAAAAVPSFEDVYSAFHTLQLVQADGRVVREWTAAHVKQAYRTLAKQLHPDVAGGDEELMERVNTSYDLLMGLSAELTDNYRMWLESGGEAELQLQRAEEQHGLQHSRWVSRDTEQLILVGWCTTFSGCVLYALWCVLYSTSSASSSAGGTAAIANRPGSGSGEAHRGTSTGGTPSTGTRLTLPWAGATVSRAAGVQYGVVSSGGSALWMPPQLSFHILQLMRTAVSRYALAVAVTLAACMNTVLLQRVFQRILTGGGGGGGAG